MKTSPKILFIGSKMIGAIEHQFVRGFSDLGYDVDFIDIKTPVLEKVNASIYNRLLYRLIPAKYHKNVSEEVIAYCDQKKPNIVLVFKGQQLSRKIIEYIKGRSDLLMNYNLDHPYLFYDRGSGNKNVLESIGLYDLYISYSNSIVFGLRNKFHINAQRLPFGYDDQAIRGINIDDIKTTDYYALIGGWDKKRSSYIEELSIDNLKIFGKEEWKERNRNVPYILERYQGKGVYNDEYYIEMGRAMGVFNIMRDQNVKESSHNMRTFEVPAAGGVLISQRTDEQQEFFEEEKEAVYFSSMEELKDRLIFLNKNPDRIDEIKRNAYQRSQSSAYSYKDRTIQLVNLIGLGKDR